MLPKQQGIGQSHGKIILLGEHAVVYNYPSIAIPFPKTSIKTIVKKANNHQTISCDFYSGVIAEMPELLDSLKEAIRLSLKTLHYENYPLSIEINSSIPAERGMGSSAAVAVATIRAIYDYFNTTLSQKELLELVNTSEKIAHGNPSGLDALMTSTLTPYYFIKGEKEIPLNMVLDAYLVVADTGQTGQTREAVESISQKLQQKNSLHYQLLIDSLGELPKKGRVALETNNAEQLGKYMTQAHNMLKELGVSCKSLDTLVDTALCYHALGAKLTGGGRGGCMIALATDKKSAHAIANALEQNGARQTWVYEMSEHL
ncbi:mevalonate kinase [Vagococcus sp. JNUCC 83]